MNGTCAILVLSMQMSSDNDNTPKIHAVSFRHNKSSLLQIILISCRQSPRQFYDRADDIFVQSVRRPLSSCAMKTMGTMTGHYGRDGH